VPPILVLGAGYIGAAVAALALDRGEHVVLADNWSATDRGQVAGLEARGAVVETADIRRAADVERLFAPAPARVVFLAAQASRPVSERDPDYTEQTNLTGARRVAQAAAAAKVPVAYGSSLHVYGPRLEGEVGPDRPYGAQGDLAHLSKVYAELCLRLFAERAGFPLALLRLGIVYGPSPVEHAAAESQTVVDKFRRLAAAGEPLALDDGGRATIGAVHVGDAARIALDTVSDGVSAANVAAETATVAQIAALARGQDPGSAPAPAWTVASPFAYEHTLADYLRAA
jgi:nucleoside-diphosphate-sugar epimerase